MTDLVIWDRFLFQSNYLCVPRGSLWDFVIWELRGGGLPWHFSRDKTIYGWRSILSAESQVKMRRTLRCQTAKGVRKNADLWILLPASHSLRWPLGRTIRPLLWLTDYFKDVSFYFCNDKKKGRALFVSPPKENIRQCAKRALIAKEGFTDYQDNSRKFLSMLVSRSILIHSSLSTRFTRRISY